MFGIGGPEVGVFLFLLFKIFTFIAVILAIFIPFFIYRIRNEIIRTNRKLDAVVDLLGGDSKKLNEIKFGSHTKPTKICPYCRTENRKKDIKCISCGKNI